MCTLCTIPIDQVHKNDTNCKIWILFQSPKEICVSLKCHLWFLTSVLNWLAWYQTTSWNNKYSLEWRGIVSNSNSAISIVHSLSQPCRDLSETSKCWYSNTDFAIRRMRMHVKEFSSTEMPLLKFSSILSSHSKYPHQTITSFCKRSYSNSVTATVLSIVVGATVWQLLICWWL